MACVVAITRLHRHVFFFGPQNNFVITTVRRRTVWCVTQVVLVAKVLRNGGINLVDGLFFGNFKELSTGFFGNTFQNFFAVRTSFLQKPLTTAVTAHAATIRTATHASAHAAKSTAI